MGSIDFRWLAVMTSFREKERQVAMFRKREKKKELRETLLYRFAHGGLKGKLDRKKKPPKAKPRDPPETLPLLLYMPCVHSKVVNVIPILLYMFVFFLEGFLCYRCATGVSHTLCVTALPPSFYFLLLLLSYCRVYRWRCIH